MGYEKAILKGVMKGDDENITRRTRGTGRHGFISLK